MAQVIISRPQTNDITIPSTGPSDLAGLIINALTGSGTIRLDVSLTHRNMDAGESCNSIHLLVDGVNDANDIRRYMVPSGKFQNLAFFTIVKPGSGQHVFKVQGDSDSGNQKIYLREAAFSLTEPGY